MRRVQKGLPIAALIAGVWFVINYFLLPYFPTVYLDEAENANHAYNLAFHGQAVFSLYDGLFPPGLAFMRHAWPVVIRPFYCFPLAGLIKVLGFGLVQVRLFSLLTGLLALFGVYAAGVKLQGKRLGLFAMVVLGTRFVFLYCSDRVRPEMMLCLCGVLVFLTLVNTLETSNSWLAMATGLLAGLAPGIHTNGVVLILPVGILLLMEKKLQPLLFVAVGWLIGISCFVLSADWSNFLTGKSALFINEFATPTLLKVHGNLLKAIALETQRYFGGWDFYDWRGGWLFHPLNGWMYAVYAAAVCTGCVRKDSLNRPARFAALLVVGYTLIVSQKQLPYVSVLEPTLALSLGVWLLSEPLPSWRKMVFGLGTVLLLFPLGKMPALLFLSLTVLPKKHFQWATLILLTSLLMISTELRGWVIQAGEDLQRMWWMSFAGLLCCFGVWGSQRRRPVFDLRGWAWSTTAAVTVGTSLFVGSIASYHPPFTKICKRLAAQMRPGARVAGPQTFWIGLSAYDYRDIGGVGWYRLLMGEKDLTRPLHELKPDYMIVDDRLAAQLGRLNRLRHAQHLQNPTNLFPWPHRVVDVFESGPVYGGHIVLIENDWRSAH